MRFVMMEHASSREEVLSFLGDLNDALAAFTAGLERYAAVTARFGERHPGLALDHGLVVHRASLQWTRHAIAALRAAPSLDPVAGPLPSADHGCHAYGS
jgi:hypothetical protein